MQEDPGTGWPGVLEGTVRWEPSLERFEGGLKAGAYGGEDWEQVHMEDKVDEDERTMGEYWHAWATYWYQNQTRKPGTCT